MSSINESKKPQQVQVDEAADAKTHYFYYYGKLCEQQNMLQDGVRMNSYHAAIAKNPQDFKDKVVLDVGTGTGVLALFAAQAGARKVYAVEASKAADVARELITANGYGHVIEVIQKKLEDTVLPEQVDIIISEPMGVALVHERMIESFVLARKFLKPSGKMLPATGTIYTSLFSDPELYKMQCQKSLFWNQNQYYGLDWRCLKGRANSERFAQPTVGLFQPGGLMSDHQQASQKTFDFLTVTLEELTDFKIDLSLTATRTDLAHGICVWFDVDLGNGVTLNTSPLLTATHWQQCRLVWDQPVALNKGQTVTGALSFVANESRSFQMSLDTFVSSNPNTLNKPNNPSFLYKVPTSVYKLQDQFYHSDPLLLTQGLPHVSVPPVQLTHSSFEHTTNQTGTYLLTDAMSQLRYAHLMNQREKDIFYKQLQDQYTASYLGAHHPHAPQAQPYVQVNQLNSNNAFPPNNHGSGLGTGLAQPAPQYIYNQTYQHPNVPQAPAALNQGGQP